jgi:site-specific recombinase XerD
MSWCDEVGLKLSEVHPRAVAAYVEVLGREISPPSVKQHLAAIRRLMDYLVTGQVIPMNPASSVRGPKHVVRRGKTPVLYEDDARKILGAIPQTGLVNLRDRALLSAMIYSFARVGAITKMRVQDFYVQGTRAWLVLHEKGGKFLKIPAHHKVAEALEAYLKATKIQEEPKSPLFRTSLGRSGKLTPRGLCRQEVGAMVKRRAKAAGLPSAISCHSFRATGITNYLANGGSLEVAAQIAGHASTTTTKLYDRRNEEISRGEIERIRI